jgi:hypothetical protein
MIKKIIIISVIIIFLSGCIDNSIYGTYSYLNSKLVLQEDGTYLYFPEIAGVPQKGSFSQNGNHIQITNVLGMTTILIITEDGLVDDKGKLWRKS